MNHAGRRRQWRCENESDVTLCMSDDIAGRSLPVNSSMTPSFPVHHSGWVQPMIILFWRSSKQRDQLGVGIRVQRADCTPSHTEKRCEGSPDIAPFTSLWWIITCISQNRSPVYVMVNEPTHMKLCFTRGIVSFSEPSFNALVTSIAGPFPHLPVQL